MRQEEWKETSRRHQPSWGRASPVLTPMVKKKEGQEGGWTGRPSVAAGVWAEGKTLPAGSYLSCWAVVTASDDQSPHSGDEGRAQT